MSCKIINAKCVVCEHPWLSVISPELVLKTLPDNEKLHRSVLDACVYPSLYLYVRYPWLFIDKF